MPIATVPSLESIPRYVEVCSRNVAVGQNQWNHFGVGVPPIFVHFSGDLDVHWGHGILTHSHVWSRLGGFGVLAGWQLAKGFFVGPGAPMSDPPTSH